MRLIDADWVLGHLKPYEPSDEEWSVTGGTALRLIHNAVDNAPTVDAVVVTRCKNCKYRTEFGNCGHPRQHGILPTAYPYDYCSYGERKDGNNAT